MMRDTLRAIRRTLFGTQPILTAGVVATAVATAALQSSGFDGWWILPVALVVCIWARARLRRSRS